MGSSGRRKLRRLQLGACKKLTVTWWIGGWTVGVHLSRAKAGKRAEKSNLSPRKTRRGQRAGASRLGRFLRDTHVDREAAKLLVSAVRYAAPLSPVRPPSEKTTSSRVVNHSGRKHLWAVKAGNRLAARRPVQQLVRKIDPDWGYLSRTRARQAVEALNLDGPTWRRFSDWWHVYSYKCRWIGAVESREGRDPISFLAGRNVAVGANDLFSLLGELRGLGQLPPPEPLPRGPRVVDTLQVCEVCGFVGTPLAPHWRRVCYGRKERR